MSRPDLAERSGVSVATILASERSGRVPHLTTARLLARAVNLDVDELFPDTEDHDGHCQADHTRTGVARREGRGFGTSTGHSTSSCKAQRTATSSRRLGLNHSPELACAAMADWAGERTGLHFIPSETRTYESTPGLAVGS
jgi:DNA-binding XRE family transcriptional regulator